MATNKSDNLKEDYDSRYDFAEKFRSALEEQIKKLISKENISLAVPIQSRVKSWTSISSKIERKNLELKEMLQLNDLVGIRLILLFKRDLDRCRNLIEEKLEIVDKEDAASRLYESQFGYQSYHYVVKLPEEWLSTPTLSDFSEYKAEIQVRTIAQHIWAAASHYFQYKQENNVPKTIRRSICRVSALLETVDLEFERVLGKREEYVEEVKPETQDEPLNVDVLKKILDTHLPIRNRRDDEEYSQLIQNLSSCGIKRSSELLSFIKEQSEKALEEDSKIASKVPNHVDIDTPIEIVRQLQRVKKKGVFFCHTGLIRTMLENKFGNRWRDES